MVEFVGVDVLTDGDDLARGSRCHGLVELGQLRAPPNDLEGEGLVGVVVEKHDAFAAVHGGWGQTLGERGGWW